MVVATVDGLVVEVVERVVHPAHVPFEAEPQAAQVGGPRDAREGGRFLGDGHDTRKEPVGALVDLAQECDRLQVLVATELVGRPLTLLPRVIEVEHRGDRVDSQPVDVVPIQPEESVGHEEVADLGSAIVEDQGSPVRVQSALGVGMLVERGPVEAAQREVIGREVRGDPVEDHPDPRVVQDIDHCREVGGGPEARGGRVVARHLVAPRAVERVLGERQELDVREPQLPAMGRQLLSRLAVPKPAAVGMAAPRSEVHLVDGHR